MDNFLTYVGVFLFESVNFWIFVVSLAVLPAIIRLLRGRIESATNRAVIVGVLLFIAVSAVNYRIWLAEHLKAVSADEILSQRFPSPFADDGYSSIEMNLLGDEQRDSLMRSASTYKDKMSPLFLGLYSHGENLIYSSNIMAALRRGGVKVNSLPITPDDISQTGVMVACDDPMHPTSQGNALLAAFREAQISVRLTKMPDEAKEYDAEGCILFLGPYEK